MCLVFKRGMRSNMYYLELEMKLRSDMGLRSDKYYLGLNMWLRLDIRLRWDIGV